MSSRLALCLAFSCLAACTVPIDTGLGGAKGGAEPPATKAWESSTNAAASAVEQGRMDDAEGHLKAARRAAAATPEGDEYAQSLMNLGNLHALKGDTTNAIVFYERALEIREQHLGEDHLEVANTLNALGAAYAQNDRYDDSEKAFRRALAIREKKLGETNLLTGQIVNNLALVCAARGQYDKAGPLYERAIDIISKAPESSRGDLIRALDNYAALLSDSGHEKEAEAVRARATEERKEYDRFHDALNPAQ